MKSKSMRWSGLVIGMEEPKNIPTVLSGKLEGK
jgi:hypothetical protein